MNYRASDIIKRAYDLADIKNTDFITHEENVQYINDAWKQVYQWLINKGDKQFVNEVRLAGGGVGGYVEYDIPDDLYQIESIKSVNGNIIPRKTTSESDSSGTYEVVNDKIRLYGCTSDLIMTYWLKPVTITYPEEDLDVTDVIGDRTIKDSISNSIWFEDGDVINVVTEEKITNISLESANSWDTLSDGNYGRTLKSNGLSSIYDFSGNQIVSKGIASTGNYVVAKYKNQLVVNNTLILNSRKLVDSSGEFVIGGNERSIFTIDSSKIYRIDQFGIKHEMLQHSTDSTTLNIYGQWNCIDIDGNQAILEHSNYIYYFDGESLIDKTDDYINPKAILKRGVLTYNGNWVVKSIYEDTLFNFPNELYTSLLAADLAVRYAMKMNANIDGLNQLYQVMQTTFMNTLTQDSGYTRINNIYRA